MGNFKQRYQKIFTLLFVVIATSIITSAVFLAFTDLKKESQPASPLKQVAAEYQPSVQQAAFSFGSGSS